MSLKKEKLIDEAQKLVLRGQFEKAIKLYEQALALDSSALNLHQKLAELYVKTGRSANARTEFETIGASYAANGFYLKAIAVYKQIQKLFPEDPSVTLTLASLNEKHGLYGNALIEYKRVYDHYDKLQQVSDAISILEKMLSVDSKNINILFKLADTLFRQGMPDQAYHQFQQLAQVLIEREDVDGFVRLAARIVNLYPERDAFVPEVLSHYLETGDAVRVLRVLQALLKLNPRDGRLWELLTDCFKKQDNQQKLKAAYERFLVYCPESLTAKIGLITLAADQEDSATALTLLDSHEQALIDAGQSESLEHVYKTLVKGDPINLALLNRLKRFYHLTGKNKGEVGSLESTIQSLQLVEDGLQEPCEIKVAEFPDEVPGSELGTTPELLPLSTETSETVTVSSQNGVAVSSEPEDVSPGTFGVGEFEIEFEIDDVSDDGSANVARDVSGEVWLASIEEMFDAVATNPRGVRFADGPDSADAQSHYDLGLAFKEMGMFDDAISEFRLASADPIRKIRCLLLQGVCLREKGQLDTSENLLTVLLNPDLTVDELCAIKYELALTLELQGHHERATALLAEVQKANSHFRDVQERLTATTQSERQLPFSDEDIDGFELA